MFTSLSRFYVTGILCLLLFAAASSYASNMAELDFRFGGGKSTLSGDWNGRASKIGLCFGFSASAHISSRFVYQVELNYVRRGAETYLYATDYDGSLIRLPTSIQFDYVEFPLLLKVQFGPNSQARPALLAGPYVSWMLDNHVIAKIPSLENGIIVTREIHDPSGFYDDPSGVDWGMVVGLALEPIVNGRKIILEFRYTLGFKKIVDDLSNNMFSFTLGFGV